MRAQHVEADAGIIHKGEACVGVEHACPVLGTRGGNENERVCKSDDCDRVFFPPRFYKKKMHVVTVFGPAWQATVPKETLKTKGEVLLRLGRQNPDGKTI